MIKLLIVTIGEIRSMRCFNNIAKLIRDNRVNHTKGFSQSDLSAKLGYKNGQFISNVERGLCSIPLKMLKKVSDVLDISKNDLKTAMLKDYEKTLDGHLETASSQEVSDDRTISTHQTAAAPIASLK